LTSNLTSSIEPVGVPTSLGYVVSTNGDACAVGIISLLWLDLANNLGVGDFSAAVGWNLVVGNGEESVGAFDVLAFVRTGANALA
jgi:hypothetical protein